jgi:hypothetical protein
MATLVAPLPITAVEKPNEIITRPVAILGVSRCLRIPVMVSVDSGGR